MATAFLGVADFVKKFFPILKTKLIQANINKDDREYTAEAITLAVIFFFFVSAMVFGVMFFLGLTKYPAIFFISSIFSMFIFLQRMIYPSVVVGRRIRDIERNLLPVLQSIFVQINSGVVLFEVLVNISNSDYGEISKEFRKVVKEINGGKPQIKALEDLASRNPSLFFRRAIWQLINGMKGGADISAIIEETNRSLSEEQVIQIQAYGGKLAPLAMFYMLIGVILPSLSITFIILFLTFINISEEGSKAIFYGFYVMIVFAQIMFIGLISMRRPNLL